MAERYTRLFSLPKNLYAESAPVLVAAGALLRDNTTDTVLAQLKLKNIGEREICAVTVIIHSLDPAGRPVGEPVRHTYLDLCVKRDGEFGQKNLAALPDKTARSYTVAVTEIVFANGKIWTGTDTPWDPLEKQKKLAEYLGDKQLAEQYGIELGAPYELAPAEQSDLWFCACGAVNREDETVCHLCKEEKARIFGAANRDMLKVKINARRERVAEKKRRKHKIIKKIAITALSATVACVAVGFLVTEVVIPALKYNNAVKIANKGEYESAIAAFEAMGDFRDSKDQIEACETAILDRKYDAAMDLMDSGEYVAASAIFEELNGYEDSETILANIRAEILGSLIADAYVGKTIIFGSYEQDNDLSNGKEGIEWIVLAKEENRILVISRYGLDCQPYDVNGTGITWERSSLRKWLNEEFLNTAFIELEQICIPYVVVEATSNPDGYNADTSNDTEDRIFILSVSELKEYLPSYTEKECELTEYAKGLGVHESKTGGWWWLRTQGAAPSLATFVGDIGIINNMGKTVSDKDVAVRPAMWIEG